MTPAEREKLKSDIKAIIIGWCETAGVDSTNPDQVEACAREIWIALEESGKLKHGMTFQGFISGIQESAWAERMAEDPLAEFARI